MKRSRSCLKADLDMLMKDTAKLKDVLLFHVVEGKMMAADLAKHEYLAGASTEENYG